MARKLASGDDDERIASAIRDVPDSIGRLNRRSYLKLGGLSLAGGGLGLTAASADADESMTRNEIEFDRVVDAVDDLGLDPTGNESVVSALNDIDSGTLVQFPEGEYLFDGQVSVGGGTYGFESVGSEPATIRVAAGYNDWLLNGHGMPGLYFRGFTVDQTASETIGCFRLIGDRVHIEDIEFDGRADVWDYDAENMLNCAIEDPDGYGLVKNVVHTEGHWARYGPGATGRIGIYTGARHAGTLRIVECDFREFGNNALYCSRNYGDVQVVDSYFENNNAAQIRIGGAGSYAENCTIVTDPDLYDGPRTFEDTSFHHRGIVIEEHFDTGSIQHQKPAGAQIRNCTIRIEDNPANGAAIHRYGNGRSLRIENTHIEYNHSDYPAAIIGSSGGFGVNPPADDPREIEFIDSTLVGTGDIDTAIDISHSDGSRIENSIIYLEGGSQDGLTITGSDGCEVVDSTISVPARATVFEDSVVTTSNLSTDEPDEIPPPPENPSLDHQLRIVGDDSSPFEYSFDVEGEVELVTDGEHPANPAEDTIHDNDDGTVTVNGVVDDPDEGDTYRFEGAVRSFSKEGSAQLYLDGVLISPAALVDTNGGNGGGELEDQLRIIADEDADAYNYSFTVDGAVSLVTEGDYPADPGGETIHDNDDGTYTVDGVVAGHPDTDTRWGGDTFAFTGTITAFSMDGPGTVLINGSAVDPDELIQSEPRSVVIEAGLHADEVAYTFRVDGDVESQGRDSRLADSSPSGDQETVTATDAGDYEVSGTLQGGQRARYVVTGTIAGMDVELPSSVRVDGVVADPAQYGLPQQVTIVGLGTPASYEFTVDGTIEADPYGPDFVVDDLSGPTAEGAVTDRIVSFRYEGEITDFSLIGSASVYVNGRQVDPTRLSEDASPYLDSKVIIRGNGSETYYTMQVDGSIYKAPDLGPVATKDEVESNQVTGIVSSEVDGYRFSGTLERLWVCGDAEVEIDD